MNREFAKGIAKVRENDFIGSIEHFSLVIKEDPNHVEAYAERAVSYLNTSQFELSMFDMNRCIELEPKNSYRYSCRAFLKSKMGDTEGAILDYEIAVQLDPDDAIAYNNLGLAQESKGYKAKAEKSFERSNSILGYNPNRFDEGNPEQNKDSDTTTKNTPTSKSGQAIAKDVFTSKSGFKEFIRFIRNGFRLKK